MPLRKGGFKSWDAPLSEDDAGIIMYNAELCIDADIFEQYIKPTLTPLNGIENKLMTIANGLIKEYRKERESQKVAYYKTIAIVILSSLLLISILVFCIVC